MFELYNHRCQEGVLPAMNNNTNITDVQVILREAANRSRRFEERIWGKLPKLYLPSLMVDKRTDTLALDNYALSVLIALLSIQRNQTLRHKMNTFSEPEHGIATVTADRETLMRITGMSKNLIAKGIQSLQKAEYIVKYAQRVAHDVYSRKNELDRYEQFAASRFVFLHPTTGQPLTAGTESSLLVANGLHYFAIPYCMVARHPKTAPATYAFSSMSSSEKRLYVQIPRAGYGIRSDHSTPSHRHAQPQDARTPGCTDFRQQPPE